MAYLEVGNLTETYKYLDKLLHYSQRFPDFPRNGTFVPPRLVNPNYVVPHRFNPVVPLTIISTVLSSIFVFARLYARRFHGARSFGPDDWLMCLAWLFGLGFSMLNILLVTESAVGRNAYDVSIPLLRKGLMLEHWNYCTYIAVQFFLRLSILAFFLRLAGVAAPMLRRLTWITIYLHCATILGSMCIAWFACTPISAIWDLDALLDGGSCPSLYPGVMVVSIHWAISDFWVVILPIPTIVSLNMPLRARLCVAGLFGIGVAASICGVARIFSVAGVYNSYNPTWNGISIIIWDQLEMSFGFIAASLPALNVLMSKLVLKTLKWPLPSTSRYLKAAYEFVLRKDSGAAERDEQTDKVQPSQMSCGDRELRSLRQRGSIFEYMDRDDMSTDIATSLGSRQLWDAEVGQPQNHDLPNKSALPTCNITVTRTFTTISQ